MMELDAYRGMAATEDRHWWFCGRRAIAEALIRSLRLPHDAKILEIGAGTGGNIAMLETFGSVTAVEMSELAREIAFEKTGRTFLSGYLPHDIPVAKGSFNLVCLFDVLEHVAEDQDSLAELHRMLNPEGKVVLTVPAHQWLWSIHDVDLHHFRRYSRSLLRERVEKAGFVVEKLSYINAALFPLVVFARLADRLRNAKAPSGHSLPPALLNDALKAVFSAERHLVANAILPFGVSLIAILGRPGAGSVQAEPIGRLAA